MAPGIIAVTGVSGFLGQRLLPLLDASDAVQRVIGLDVRDPTRGAKKLEFHRTDVAGADLSRLLKDVDIVVHLAAIVGPMPDDALATRVNVEGTRRMLAAAVAAGVRKVVRPSSAAVYGAWPNNAVPLTEDATLRPNPGYLPAIHDAECERLVAEWRDGAPGRIATRLRIAPVVGPGAQTVFAAAATGRAPIAVRDATPPVQVVHVDDVASALARAVEADLDGVFNVAADGWLSHEEASALLPRRRMPGLPYEAAQRVLGALWSTGLGDAPPTMIPYLVHSWVVANDRLKEAGWQPRHSNDEAILLSSPPRHNDVLPWIAAVGAVVIGAVASTWWLTHRRRARARSASLSSAR